MRVIATLAVLISFITSMGAQSKAVELLGNIPARQISGGLGFNLDPGQEWQWAAAAAAGAKYARFQCSWSAVEKQSAPPSNRPASPQYVQDPQCALGLGFARKYNMNVTLVAAFGPPYHPVVRLRTMKDVRPGDSTMLVEYTSGFGGETLSSLRSFYDYIQEANGKQFTNHHSYQGALIIQSTLEDSLHARLTLASAVNVAVSAGTELIISEVLYPSTLTERASDPSVIAYGNYVSFLAGDMAARGVKGQIELWNEPPWASDPWDNRCLLYDHDLSPPCPSTPGSPSSPNQPNYGFVANLQNKSFPLGVTVVWNGTSGSGWASVLGPRMHAESGVFAQQPNRVVTNESFHPYGFEPEEMLWTQSCLEQTTVASQASQQNINVCYLPGEPKTSNYSYAVRLNIVAQHQNKKAGIGHEITETGFLPPVAGLMIQQARFIMRQFVGFEADEVTPVEFYKLYDRGAVSDPSFSFVERRASLFDYTPKPAYTALAGFMNDIRPIGTNPSSGDTDMILPSVVAYEGTYPLSTVNVIGRRAGEIANSDAFIVWQRSYTSCSSGNNCGVWITQTSPPPALVRVSIPREMRVTRIVNLTTRGVVDYTESGNVISIMAADDPIELFVDPEH